MSVDPPVSVDPVRKAHIQRLVYFVCLIFGYILSRQGFIPCWKLSLDHGRERASESERATQRRGEIPSLDHGIVIIPWKHNDGHEHRAHASQDNATHSILSLPMQKSKSRRCNKPMLD